MIEPSNIEPSNLIEYRTLSNPWDIRSIEPSNIEPSNLIEYRTFFNQQIFDRSNHRISNIELRIRIFIEWFGNPSLDISEIYRYSRLDWKPADIYMQCEFEQPIHLTNSEKKAAEQTWIHLLVGGYSVRVYNDLITLCEFVCGVVCWRNEICSNHIQDRHYHAA